MKNAVILSIAVLMLARPLWPIAEYIMNYDYISNVLCENKNRPQLECDGKCYLAEMLAKESKQNEENPFGEKQAQTEFLFINDFMVVLNKKSSVFDITVQNNYKSTDEFISHLLVHDISKPPQA